MRVTALVITVLFMYGWKVMLYAHVISQRLNCESKPASSVFRYVPKCDFVFSSTSLMGKGFSPLRAPVCCSDALSETTEIKFTWLAVFPGAKRIQAARSACYFAHDSSYLSPSLDQCCPARSGKLGKSAVAASSLRISWRTGTGLLYISHLSFSVWQESQYWRVCLPEYV